jgi:hypothetical protein
MVNFLTLMAALVSVKDCGAGKAAFKIHELSVNPVMVNPGEPLTLHMKYEVPQGLLVKSGTAKYAVNYNFIPLSPTIEPLCSNVPCPLGPGIYTNDTKTTWPTGLSGSVTTTITWLDESSKLLACIAIASKSR